MIKLASDLDSIGCFHTSDELLRLAQLITNAPKGNWNAFLFDPNLMWSDLWQQKGLVSSMFLDCLNAALSQAQSSGNPAVPYFRKSPGSPSETQDEFNKRFMMWASQNGRNQAWFGQLMNCIKNKIVQKK